MFSPPLYLFLLGPPSRQPYPESLNPFTASSSYSSLRDPLLQVRDRGGLRFGRWVYCPQDQDVSLDEALQRQKLKDLKKVDKNMGVVQVVEGRS